MRALRIALLAVVATRAWVPRTRATVDADGGAGTEDGRLAEVTAQLREVQFAYRRLQESVHEDAAANRRLGAAAVARAPIPRVRFDDLTDAAYLSHAASGVPLVVEGMPSALDALTLEVLVRFCGSRSVTLKERRNESDAWAGLVAVGTTTLAAFAARPDAPFYLHDAPLPALCPEALAAVNFTAPRLFGGRQDLFAALPPGRLHGAAASSWPSLFLGAAGTSSGLHSDALESHFWMRVLGGAKRYAVATRKDAALLCPIKSAAASSERFRASLLDDGPPACAAAAAAAIYEGVVRAGDFIFIPSGSPHEVLNLGAEGGGGAPALAVSMNYCDAANAKHFARALRKSRHSGALGLLLARDGGRASDAAAAEAAERRGEAAFLERLDALAAAFDEDPTAALSPAGAA